MEQGFSASELWSVVWHCVAVVLRVGSDRAVPEADPPGAGHPMAELDWNLLSPQGRSCRTAGRLPGTLLCILSSDLPTPVRVSTWFLRPEGLRGLLLRVAIVFQGERVAWPMLCPGGKSSAELAV